MNDDETVSREIIEEIAMAARRLEESAFFGPDFTTGGSPVDSNLTIEKLQAAYDQAMFGGGARDGLPRPFVDHWPWPGGQMSYGGLTYASMPIYTSRFLGTPFTPEPPAMAPGPYYQRRIKRWRRAHPSYMVGDGRYFLIDNREVWCHPDDLPKLKEAVENIHPVDKGGAQWLTRF